MDENSSQFLLQSELFNLQIALIRMHFLQSENQF